MLSQKVFSKSAHTQKQLSVCGVCVFDRDRQTSKQKLLANPLTHTHVQPVKVTNRVAIKFHMLITCVALTTQKNLSKTTQKSTQYGSLSHPPPPSPTMQPTDRWRQIALASLTSPSHVTNALFGVNCTAVERKYFRYFKLTTLRSCGPRSMTILLSYLSTIKQHTRPYP